MNNSSSTVSIKPPHSKLALGKITRPHGYLGSLFVICHGTDSSSFSQIKKVYVGSTPQAAVPYTIREASWMPRGWKITLDGVDSEEAAKALRGMILYADRTELPQTEDDEYFVADLIGSEVQDLETHEPLGQLVGIESVGNQPNSGSPDRWWIRKDKTTFAVLATKRYVAKVERESRRIWLQNLSDLL